MQQKGENYGTHEEGNTLPLDNLFEYISTVYPEQTKQFYKEKLTLSIKNLIIDTILSVKKQMVVGKKDYNFELFGYDFLVDEDLRVWLIECNTNPYLGVANDFIDETLPKLADDLLKIIVDPVFPPKNK